MGNPRKWLHSVATFELGMPNFDPVHNYLIHNASLPLPQFVKEFPFDMILINSSFLTSVFDRARLKQLKKDYSFIKYSDAFKVALPQDDYYCCEELDGLVTEWGINLLYTICPNYWDTLYSKYIASGGMIKLGYTGYITTEMLSRIGKKKSAISRKYDLTYRASGKPTFPNKLATLKANIGNIFTQNIYEPNLNMDIASGQSSMISGAAWWDFVENSRCVLGSMSGSSNLIRNHDVTDRIRNYQSSFPEATDDQIIAECLPDGDADRIYEMISPRIIEAGLFSTVQLLVQGSYSNLIKPYEDFIPIKGNFLEGDTNISNKEELSEVLKDISLQEKIAETCKTTLLNSNQLYLSNFFQNVFDEYFNRNKSQYVNDQKFNLLKAKYIITMSPFYKLKFFTGNAIHYLRSHKHFS